MEVSSSTNITMLDSAPVETRSKSSIAQDQTKEALKDITFGSIAGIAGKYVEYPFDTVKVRLQSQPDHLPPRYTGPWDCFKQSWHKDGFMGFYRGVSAPLFGAAVETSSLFFSYRLAQDAYRTVAQVRDDVELGMKALLICGAASGAFTSLLLTPIELIKCKMQVPLETSAALHVRPSGILSHIASVYRHQGLMGFWHGQMGTLIRETGGSAAWFGSNEGVKLFFHRAKHGADYVPKKDDVLPIWQQMVAGASAGMSYNFIFYPADTIKSRMQTEDVSLKTGSKTSFWTVGNAFYKQQGIRGLYTGCGITVMRSAPSSAIIFTIYGQLCKTWG